MRFQFYSLIVVFLGLGFARGQGFSAEIIAMEGDLLSAEIGLSYADIGSGEVNSLGEIVFISDFQDPANPEAPLVRAIVRRQNQELLILAQEGEIIPEWTDDGVLISGARYESLGDPVIAEDGRVAFQATFTPQTGSINEDANDLLVVVAPDSTEIAIVARSGRNARITDTQDFNNSVHERFGETYFDQEGVLSFESLVSVNLGDLLKEYYQVLYQVPVLEFPVNREVTISPEFLTRGEPFQLSPDRLPNEQKGIAVSTSAQSASQYFINFSEGHESFTRRDLTEITELLSTGDPLPGSPDFQVSSIRRIAQGESTRPPFVVTGTFTSEEKTILLRPTSETGSLLSVLAEPESDLITGMPPGFTFLSLGETLSVADRAYAFTATLEAPDGSRVPSLWRSISEGVAPRLLAVAGEAAPGSPTGVTFRSFGKPAINELGQVVFPAYLEHGFGIASHNDFAFYIAESDRVVTRLIGSGDLFFFGFLNPVPIQELSLGSLSSMGDAIMTLKSSTGESSLVKFSIPLQEFISYDQWAEENLPDLAERGRASDPDGDGHNNLLEYAFGSNPLDEDSIQLIQPIVTSTEGMTQLAIEFSRLNESSEIFYEVESSQDLRNWNLVETEMILSEDAERSLVRVDAPPADLAKGFLRVRVTER